MTDEVEERQETDRAVAAYKRLLKTYLDLRPSGTRQRIAAALGTHKSFISQITSPNYRVPLPAQHIATIVRICHFSPEERRRFMDAYREAHPNQALTAADEADSGHHALSIEVPHFEDPERQRQVEETIRLMAARIIALARSGA